MSPTFRTRHVTLRLPTDLADSLAREAKARGVTLTAAILERLNAPSPENVHTQPTQPTEVADGDRVLALDDELYTIARTVAQRMEAVPLLQQLGVKVTTAQAVRLALTTYTPSDAAPSPPVAPPRAFAARPAMPPAPEPEVVIPDMEAKNITKASADFSDKTPDTPINPRPAPPKEYAPNPRWTSAANLPDDLAVLQAAHRAYLSRGWSLWSMAQSSGRVSWFYWSPDPMEQQTQPLSGAGDYYLYPYSAGSSGTVHLVMAEAKE